ncbi:hypothetical protein [Nocardioides litoris]|uniref:hypothetical protein n=1 Tax=Nocardioides litoris TaxID=1926648 RepID=UPI00111D18E0|nr:hypothetical protein [Nocardioides litoris]
MPTDDDDAWRAIVDNYGERAELDPEDGPEDGPDARLRDAAAPRPRESPAPTVSASWDDAYPDSDWTSDRFVPPPPPPVPRTTPVRTVAWAGVLGSPLALLACLLLQVPLPELLIAVLVAGFVGGFLYLVLTMDREPRDPDDDGAVL